VIQKVLFGVFLAIFPTANPQKNTTCFFLDKESNGTISKNMVV